jgi:hypothetical protein
VRSSNADTVIGSSGTCDRASIGFLLWCCLPSVPGGHPGRFFLPQNMGVNV